MRRTARKSVDAPLWKKLSATNAKGSYFYADLCYVLRNFVVFLYSLDYDVRIDYTHSTLSFPFFLFPREFLIPR